MKWHVVCRGLVWWLLVAWSGVCLAPVIAQADVWRAVSPMAQPRVGQSATLLPGGDVLVVGGYNAYDVAHGTAPSTPSELFDPRTRSWRETAPAPVARADTLTSLLPDGRVLVIGHVPSGCCEEATTAEAYDPSSDTWIPLPVPAELQDVETLTGLRNGRVLLVGRFGPTLNGPFKVGAALFDPNTDTWSNATSPNSARESGASATLMNDGDVLLAGGFMSEQLSKPPAGYVSAAVSSAEEYDPSTNSWTTLAPMGQARANQAAALLSDGSLLLAGGVASQALSLEPTISEQLASAEIYDPASNAWRPVAGMNMARYLQTATTLPDGDVLVAGGGECNPETGSNACLSFGTPEAFGDCCAASSAEVYEPAFNRWTLTEPVTTGIRHTATLLQDGEVLVAGGNLHLARRELSSAYLFGPAPAAPAAPEPTPSHSVASTKTSSLTLAHLKQSHRVWRERGVVAGRRSRRRIPLGTTFTFTLNRRADVELTFTQRLRGTRSRRGCQHRAPRSSRHACDYPKQRGSVVFAARAGANRIAFRGVLAHGKHLPAGSYILTAVAHSARAHSAADTLAFTIMR